MSAPFYNVTSWLHGSSPSEVKFFMVDLRVCFGQISKPAVSSHLKTACSLGPVLLPMLPCYETQETTWSTPEANSGWSVPKLTQLLTDSRHITCAPGQVILSLVSRPREPLSGTRSNCQHDVDAFLGIYTQASIHSCTHTHTHKHKNTRVHLNTQTHTCACIHTYKYTHTLNF